MNDLRQRLSDIGSLEVKADHGTAVLRGEVPTKSISWQYLDCCRHAAGVINVIDQLVVKYDKKADRHEAGEGQFPEQPRLVGLS